MADSTGSGFLRACSKCGQMNDAGAVRCLACSEPFEALGPPPTNSPTDSHTGDLVEDPLQLLGRIVNGKYEVLSILGEGGMGVVYKVRHLILQNKNTFALKVLHPRLCAQPDFQTRFLREVEIAMELTHENIIQIRDFGLTEQNLLFYTMDFFAGESLKSLIERSKAIPPQRVVRIAKQILLALSEAHKAGIIHRDLKPDNLLIEQVDGQIDNVRILDFGIAKVLVGDFEAEDRNLTQGGVIGTPKYMSPEQASGEKVDARSDLYALGCILYEMLTGQPPFTGKTARSILVSHLTACPPPFEKMRSGLHVPPRLENLVFQLLAKNRDERPASAETVLDILDGRRSEAAPPEKRPAKERSRSWLPVSVAAALVIIAGVVALVPISRGAGKVEATGGARNATAARPGQESPGEAESSSSNGGEARPRSLRCNVCGAVYGRGTKVGDMCHGEPLVEIQ